MDCIVTITKSECREFLLNRVGRYANPNPREFFDMSGCLGCSFYHLCLILKEASP